MIKNIIFDLDGTLLNTIEDLADSVNYTMEKLGFPQRTLTEVYTFVGNGINNLIKRSLPDNVDKEDEILLKNARDYFDSYYRENMTNKTQPYPGIMDLLRTLKSREFKMGIVSNKADYAVQKINSHYFHDLFDAVYGELPGIPRKPAPDLVYKSMDTMGANQDNTIYIGDSEVDYTTARNSGLPVILVTWGFRPGERLMELSPDYLVQEPGELISILGDRIYLNNV